MSRLDLITMTYKRVKLISANCKRNNEASLNLLLKLGMNKLNVDEDLAYFCLKSNC